MGSDPTLKAPLLITGASGFIGSEIVRQAHRQGFDVRAPDEHEVDLLDRSALGKACAGAGAVIHAAGLAHIFDKERAAAAPFKRVNEEGTANIAGAAVRAGVRHLVLVSSVSVYGGGAGAGSDESAPCLPAGAYAQSKRAAELRAEEITSTSSTELTVLRFATAYGGGDPGNVGRLMRAIDRGRFVWIGTGSNRKSLLHRSDAAAACMAALRRPAGGRRVYNVSAAPCTMREIVEILGKHLGRQLPRWRIPAGVMLGVTAMGSLVCLGHGPLAALHGTLHKWLEDDLYPAERIREELGFEPTVGLEEGLGEEVEEYRRQKAGG